MAVVITLQREKCIGCNYCVESAPEFFRMSKKDGKAVLLHADKKGEFEVYKSFDNEAFKQNESAAKRCPVKIIQVKKTE